jgi:hypothetical protein
MEHLQPRTRTVLAWCWWLATFGCCAAGLVGALVVTRPLTVGVLSNGAGYALVFPLGYATVGLVLSLRRPANPIGWLYAASGLSWSLNIPGQPWLEHLVGGGHPLPPAAQLAAVIGEINWDPAICLASSCRPCWSPTGGCARAAGGWSPPLPWSEPGSTWWAPAWHRDRCTRRPSSTRSG